MEADLAWCRRQIRNDMLLRGVPLLVTFVMLTVASIAVFARAMGG